LDTSQPRIEYVIVDLLARGSSSAASTSGGFDLSGISPSLRSARLPNVIVARCGRVGLDVLRAFREQQQGAD
jgi:hypothetical protein